MSYINVDLRNTGNVVYRLTTGPVTLVPSDEKHAIQLKFYSPSDVKREHEQHIKFEDVGEYELTLHKVLLSRAASEKDQKLSMSHLNFTFFLQRLQQYNKEWKDWTRNSGWQKATTQVLILSACAAQFEFWNTASTAIECLFLFELKHV